MTAVGTKSPEILDYWRRFYAAHAAGVPMQPSDFAQQMRRDHGLTGLVVDIGTGSGRDALWIAGRATSVIACDATSEAVDLVRHAARVRRHTNIDVRRVNIGLPGDLAALSTAIGQWRTANQNDDESVTLYARFLLHAIPVEIEWALVAWARSVLHVGERFLLEYRTAELDADEYVFGSHYRRPVDPAEFIQVARQAGFSQVHTEMSRDFAVFGDERPLVARSTLEV